MWLEVEIKLRYFKHIKHFYEREMDVDNFSSEAPSYTRVT